MSSTSHYLDHLNAEQRRAVEHGLEGGKRHGAPLLIIAGAGTGKTNTLAHRVAHLIVHGADPARMLLLTFSRRAAAEMERRVARILDAVLGAAARPSIAWSGTFHAVGARLLRMHARAIGLDAAFTVHDREDSADLMQLPELAAELAAQFDHVLVDEYQDTNALQATILRRLKPDGAGLTVVGDDAQAIYGFRAASVRNILDFPGQFDPAAAIIRLEQNYRSTQPILAACNAVIGLASERFTKTLRSHRCGGDKPSLVSVLDDAAQVGFVVACVLDNREGGMALKEQAVLFRASHHSAMLEVELARRNIPFVKYGGLKFVEAAHIKDVLAVLRWAENPHDRVAGFRVLQLIDGIGPATAGRMLEQLAAAGPAPRLSAVSPPPRGAAAWGELVALLAPMAAGKSAWPVELDLVRRWYQPVLEACYADAALRVGDLEQLHRIAALYPSRGKFLTDLVLDPPSASGQATGPPLRDEDYLILSTIHSAKGQEWKAVLILNAVDGCIPSDMATGSMEEIEEERRLLYVAMTRAKDQLALILPQRFYILQQARAGDRHVYAARTRFIPERILDAFQWGCWPSAGRVGEGVARRPAAPIDLGARVRARWGSAGG